jgi:hypothetical protein
MLGMKGQREGGFLKEADTIGIKNYLGFVALAQIIREIVLYVVCELVLVLRVEAQHIHESLHVYALKVAISQSFDIAPRLDNDVV